MKKPPDTHLIVARTKGTAMVPSDVSTGKIRIEGVELGVSLTLQELSHHKQDLFPVLDGARSHALDIPLEDVVKALALGDPVGQVVGELGIESFDGAHPELYEFEKPGFMLVDSEDEIARLEEVRRESPHRSDKRYNTMSDIMPI